MTLDQKPTSLADFLAQVRERAAKAVAIRSDDFGHNTEKLRDWCETEIQVVSEDTIPRLLAIIEAMGPCLGRMDLASIRARFEKGEL